MDRISAIQAALEATSGSAYLEIGVCTGESFIPTKAKRKWGVDPAPVLSWKRLAKYELFSALSLKDEKIFRETSDQFFESRGHFLSRYGVDVSFVDGLHTYDQALRDIENSVKYLNEPGYVLVHDCNPQSESAAIPRENIESVSAEGIPGWTGVWNGDVWKAIVHLRSQRNDLQVFVLDCDHGVGVVRRGRASEQLPFTPDEIRRMGYSDLAADRTRLLGLRPPEFLHEILSGQVG